MGDGGCLFRKGVNESIKECGTAACQMRVTVVGTRSNATTKLGGKTE